METCQMFYAHFIDGETEPHAVFTCPTEVSGPLALCYSWLWRPGGPVCRSGLKIAGVRVAEDCICEVQWLCTASQQEFDKHLLVIHILISLGDSPPISTFLLLSDSGTAWDWLFLLL